jgi:hypothetical protein
VTTNSESSRRRDRRPFQSAFIILSVNQDIGHLSTSLEGDLVRSGVKVATKEEASTAKPSGGRGLT